MPQIRINVAELGRTMGALGRRLERGNLGAIRRTARAGAPAARRIASSNTPQPKATGKYLRGWKAVDYAKSSAVVNTSGYAVYIENGRRAGAKMPPINAIKRWLRVKRMNVNLAFPIARAIAQRGIPARPVLPLLVRFLTSRLAQELKVGVRTSFRGSG